MDHQHASELALEAKTGSLMMTIDKTTVMPEASGLKDLDEEQPEL